MARKRQTDGAPSSVQSDHKAQAPAPKKGPHRWQPGQSGNPMTQFKPGNPGGPGRPKRVREIEDALIERFGDQIPTMVEYLLDGAYSGKVKLHQIVALEKAMDRIIGKARQRLEHSGPDGGAIPIKASDELLERAKSILEAEATKPAEG